MLRESKLSQLIHHSDESSLALVAKVTERKVNHILVQAGFPPKPSTLGTNIIDRWWLKCCKDFIKFC